MTHAWKKKKRSKESSLTKMAIAVANATISSSVSAASSPPLYFENTNTTTTTTTSTTAHKKKKSIVFNLNNHVKVYQFLTRAPTTKAFSEKQTCTAHHYDDDDDDDEADNGSQQQLVNDDESFCPTNTPTTFNSNSNSNSNSNNKLFTKLRRYGISGILSYGLLNTVYYLTTFFFVWFYIAPAPGRLGYAAAVERFLKVMAMVWLGSQVTKLARAAGALALAPLVSRGLTWFTRKFKFESEGKAFMAIVGFCFGLALLLFFSVTLLWA